MTLSTEQLEQRRHGLGSSDIALLVEGRYRQVWLSKVHPEQYAIEFPQNPQMALGHRLEPFVAQWCSELYEPLVKCDETLVGPEPWMLFTPDYLADRYPNAPYEIKAWAFDFSENGCPFAVEGQLRWQMICRDDQHGYVAGWNRKDTKPPVRFTFERDTKLEKEIVEGIARPFWFGHVVAKKEPPPDVVKEHPRFADGEGLKIDAEHPLRELVRAYELRSREARDSEEAAKVACAELRSAMKYLGWIEGDDFGKIYHREYPGKTKVDYEQVARMLAMEWATCDDPKAISAIGTFERLVKQHTTVGHPFRKLIPKWKHAPQLVEQDPEEENDDDGEEVLG